MSARRWNDTPYPNAWSDDDLRRLHEWAGHVPTDEIARRLGRTRSAVQSMASKRGWCLRVRPRMCLHAHGTAWAPDDIGRLRRLARADASVAYVASALGRTPRAVKAKAAALGISFMRYGPRNVHTRYPTEVVQEIARLQAHGVSVAETARRLDMSADYIYKVRARRRRWREAMAADAQEGNAHD